MSGLRAVTMLIWSCLIFLHKLCQHFQITDVKYLMQLWPGSEDLLLVLHLGHALLHRASDDRLQHNLNLRENLSDKW